jgi:serine/threonine protein kinase
MLPSAPSALRHWLTQARGDERLLFQTSEGRIHRAEHHLPAGSGLDFAGNRHTVGIIKSKDREKNHELEVRQELACHICSHIVNNYGSRVNLRIIHNRLALRPGTRLGPYEILAAIGAGGMGEVYKARDTRLDRTVAIKILPEALAADSEFRDRFDREARTISQLDHPHICALYDVGTQDGTAYLVMQYLEGETLAHRLTKGALPIDQALQYAIEIANALDAAHKAGVVHRDLKPGNVMLTRSGATLLDFGLAKAAATAGSVAGLSILPTTPPGLTAQGAILGTFQYMAPEQLEGREADARTDIFAFGAVLYEMLTGKMAFEGKNQASLIGAILHIDPPPVTALRPLLPPFLDRVVKKCLSKDPDHRWQTARDLSDELKWISEGGTAVPTVPARIHNPWRERVAWITAAAGVLIALFIILRPSSAPAAGDVVRFSILPPDKTLFTGQSSATIGVPQLALSPDGRAIVFAAAAPGARPTLWLRSLDGVTAQSLPGTEGAESPVWSADHRWIGYFADGRLKKIPAGGGPSQLIAANVADNRQASWGPDDTILFSKGTTGILRVSSSGGTVTPVTELDASRQEGSHRFPQFLPDGRHFLYTVRSSLADQAGVYAGALDGKMKKLLIRGNTTALYAPSGYVLFLDGDTLMGQAFDAARLELQGHAFLVEGGVGRSSTGSGAYSVSGTGVLAYAGALSTPGHLTWFDRGGNPSESVGSLGDYTDFRLSPDQTRLAASLADPKTGYPDIWITDLTRGSSAPFTFGPTVNAHPVWAPDGARIIFRTNRTGGMDEFYAKSAGGGGKEEPVLTEATARAAGVLSGNVRLWDWSPDGQQLLFSAPTSSDYELWLVPVARDAKPVSLLSAPGDQIHGNISPNGRLVAYSSNESGRFEVRVQTLPLTDHLWTVSTTGGFEPRWRADGREMYYLSLDQKLMAVGVGPGPSFGAPAELFPVRVAGGLSEQRTHYVPSRDGQRFLINTPTGDAAMVPITVVLNWTAGLK